MTNKLKQEAREDIVKMVHSRMNLKTKVVTSEFASGNNVDNLLSLVDSIIDKALDARDKEFEEVIDGLSLSSWLMSINNDSFNVEQAERYADDMTNRIIKTLKLKKSV